MPSTDSPFPTASPASRHCPDATSTGAAPASESAATTFVYPAHRRSHPPGVFALQLAATSLYILVYAAGASAQRRERRRKHDRLLREAPEDADRLADSLLDVQALRAVPFRLDHPLNLLLHLLLATALPMLCEVVEAAVYPDGGEGPLELARAAVPPHIYAHDTPGASLVGGLS